VTGKSLEEEGYPPLPSKRVEKQEVKTTRTTFHWQLWTLFIRKVVKHWKNDLMDTEGAHTGP